MSHPIVNVARNSLLKTVLKPGLYTLLAGLLANVLQIDINWVGLFATGVSLAYLEVVKRKFGEYLFIAAAFKARKEDDNL